MKLRTLATAVVVACALALPSTPALAAPASTIAPFGESAVANPRVSVLAAKKKPKAVVTATFTTLPSNNKVSVEVTSNAKQVQVKYRTAKNKKRALNRKLKSGKATIVLPAGSKKILVRAKATSKLATSPWTPATPPAPPAPPTVTTPPVISPPAGPPPVVTQPGPDTTAPGQVTGLQVSGVKATSITLSWTNPTDADLAAVIVHRDGVHAYAGVATTVTFTDNGLAPDTDYTYGLITRDMDGNTSTPVTVTVTTVTVLDPPTTRVSVASDGTQADFSSTDSSVSADGRYVAFASNATNLVAGDTNNASDCGDVFVRDRQTGTTTRASVASNGTQANGCSFDAAISADGRYVAFSSRASNLVVGDTNNLIDVFVHDRQDGTTTRVSLGAGGVEGDNHSSIPAISGDGRYVTFASMASNLVTGGTSNDFEVFVHDRDTATTTLVSVASDGAHGNDLSYRPEISSDGRYITFESAATNLVVGDTNTAIDVFVRDQTQGTTTRVSVDAGGTQANNESSFPAISGDGRYVTFASDASNLVGGDNNGQTDVFLHDRQNGATTRVSIATDGTEANNWSRWSALSSDGRYVAFASQASNFVVGDTNYVFDVFVHDRQTGSTSGVSVGTGGSQTGLQSIRPAMSTDGRFITFESEASNLVPGDTNGRWDVFVQRMW